MSNETLSVTELNRRARQTLERALPLLWVAGEISNLVRAASGHVYFSLKDEQAQVRCVMFRSRAQLLPWQLENGQQVEVQALVTIYEARGDFRLNVEAMRRAGLGRLYEAFARLRAKLESEGLFASGRKRPLPRFPRAIGVVTSLQAAALRDVGAACRRRAAHVPLLVFPTPVQGEGAADQIAQAIAAAAASELCDVLLLVRGGGSIEDLWAFNEEAVARAIAASAIPVIAGVGHETDVTIADFAADHRAATPTAAAELATAGWFAAGAEVGQLHEVLRRRMEHQIESAMQQIDTLARRLLHPRQRLDRFAQQAAHLRTRLGAAIQSDLQKCVRRLADNRLQLSRRRPDLGPRKMRLTLAAHELQQGIVKNFNAPSQRLAKAAEALALLDPKATLARGYSITRAADGSIVRSSEGLTPGAELRLSFAHGWANTKVSDKG